MFRCNYFVTDIYIASTTMRVDSSNYYSNIDGQLCREKLFSTLTLFYIYCLWGFNMTLRYMSIYKIIGIV